MEGGSDVTWEQGGRWESRKKMQPFGIAMAPTITNIFCSQLHGNKLFYYLSRQPERRRKRRGKKNSYAATLCTTLWLPLSNPRYDKPNIT